MTTRTRTPRTRKAAATVVPQRIPADMMGLGFVAVALRFPEPATAHRVAYVAGAAIRDDTTASATLAGNIPVRTETRAACQATAEVAGKVYELSAPTAHHRGAVACTDPACFGVLAA